VIPIRGSSGAHVDSKKKYPSIKAPSPGAMIVGGIVGGAIAAKFKWGPIWTGLAAGAGVSTVANTVHSKKAKGESDKHLANRISNWMNSRKRR
jgi:hypothetical protein